MKALKRIGAFVLAIAVLVAFLFVIPRGKTENNRFLIVKGQRPLLIAHGGGNKEFPDNTLEAFYNAYGIDSGCMLETDVSITKDGVVILCHDRTLDRTTDVSGAIIDWNFSDLLSQEVDFGFMNKTSGDNGTKTDGNLVRYTNFEGNTVSPLDVTYPEGVSPRHDSKFLVTTLEELIKIFPNNTVNVEIKQQGETGLKALEAVVKMLDELDGEYNTFDRVVLASFHKEIYDKIKDYASTDYKKLQFSPNSDGILLLYATHWIGLDFLYNEPVTVLQIPMKEKGLPLDMGLFISAAHRHGIAVHYWTINDPDDMRKLAERGADGIMSDIPSLLKGVLDDMYGAQ